MIQDISNRLLRDFASCLQQTMGAGAAPAPGPSPPARPPLGGPAADPASGAAPPQPEPAAAPETPLGPPRAANGAPPPRPAAPAATPPPPRPAKPVSAFRLILGVLRDRLVRLLHRIARLFSRGRGDPRPRLGRPLLRPDLGADGGPGPRRARPPPAARGRDRPRRGLRHRPGDGGPDRSACRGAG